ncbi:hypothetical protein AcV5_005284 [Taiwanofungus camphoratus]|nr:hypothetical protein AcV5_005284 [Antrodia cinnamomea]
MRCRTWRGRAFGRRPSRASRLSRAGAPARSREQSVSAAGRSPGCAAVEWPPAAAAAVREPRATALRRDTLRHQSSPLASRPQTDCHRPRAGFRGKAASRSRRPHSEGVVRVAAAPLRPGPLDGSAARRDWRAVAGIAGPACEPFEAWLDGPRATHARTVRAGAPLRCAHVAQTKPRPSLPDCACPAISDFVSPLGGGARVGRFPGSSSMLWRLPLGTTITMRDRAPYS